MWWNLGASLFAAGLAVAVLWRRTEHPLVTYQLGIVEGERRAAERRKGERRGGGEPPTVSGIHDLHALR